jgi:putative hydrolase of the HAD superfamily
MNPAIETLSPANGRIFGDRSVDWIFDLDNTLYPAADKLFAQVSERIRLYISEFLGLDAEAAYRLQKRYFEEYGTSLRGLMICHEMDPEPFLRFVHEVDLDSVAPNPALDSALEAIRGRKIIFTNASTDHAERILDRLGVVRHFSDIFDIAAAGYVPKPEPAAYDDLVRRFGLDCRNTVMIDDIARNLAPAAALGMTTVWLRNEAEWGNAGSKDGFVHHIAEDLVGWLTEIAAEPR